MQQRQAGCIGGENGKLFRARSLPSAGFDNVTPGEYRPPIPEGKDWMKKRVLSTVEGVYYVAYSRMDAADQARLTKALEGAKPDKLRGLKTADFTASMGKLYTELDYIHPFNDGNSRTLREFTKQLTNESGYELDWDRFNYSAAGRDVLYIARDLSVNALAKPHIQHENSMQKIVHTVDSLEGNRDLPDLLRDAIRPSRAVAFERLLESEALQVHPELESAYKTLHAATAYFEAKMPSKPESQQQALKAVSDQIQESLNKGETTDFAAHHEAAKKEWHTD